MEAGNQLLNLKQNVAELEAKQIKEQVAKEVEARVNEVTARLKEEQRKFMEEMRQKFAEQLQLATSKIMQQCGKKNFQDSWIDNRWHTSSADIYGQEIRVSVDGLIALPEDTCEGAIVRAEQPVSRAILTSMTGQQKLVYYEVFLKRNSAVHFIGWADPDFLLHYPKQQSVYHLPGSFALNFSGKYWQSGRQVHGSAEGFRGGDVVGTGLLLTRNGEFRLFFTKNGQMNIKPFVLDSKNQLYPTVNFDKGNSVEVNFGANTEKPFKFDIDAHAEQMFN